MKDEVRLQLVISSDLMVRIEDYWHKHKLPNKSTAIRQLIEMGLASNRKK
jgi:metal-responsive CopG/Arc/MetJ family transcriptional regulator